MLFRSKNKDVDPKERAIWGDLTALGMVFPIAIALGYFLGRWLGRLAGYPKAGILIGLAWGIGAGFWELYKTTIRLNRMDESGPPVGKDSKDSKDDDDRPGA
jgi:F0F1-type ATP synthase assembly protein I